MQDRTDNNKLGKENTEQAETHPQELYKQESTKPKV